MNDKTYFSKYKNSFKQIFAPESEDCAFIKDADLKCQAVSDKMLEFIGIENKDNFIGKTFPDILELSSHSDIKLIDRLNNKDTKIISGKKRATFLELLPYNGANKFYIHYKIPIINLDTGNCCWN